MLKFKSKKVLLEIAKIYKEIYDQKEHNQQHMKTNVNCEDLIPRRAERIKLLRTRLSRRRMIWLLPAPFTPPPRRQTGRPRKTDNLLTGERNRGLVEEPNHTKGRESNRIIKRNNALKSSNTRSETQIGHCTVYM
jgi:hypothetical protein